MKKTHLSRRDFLRGTAVAGASALFVACTPAATPTEKAGETQPTPVPPQANEPVTLRFVTNHGEADMPLFTQVIDNFKAKEPNITIDHLDIADGNAFYDLINTQGASKQLPDVWYTRTFDVPVYASKGWTIGLSDYVDADAAEVNVADFWPAEVDQMTFKGKLYALPYDFSNIGIYYNKDMFTAAGEAMPPSSWKWDDLAALSTKFVKKDELGQFHQLGPQYVHLELGLHGPVLWLGWQGLLG